MEDKKMFAILVKLYIIIPLILIIVTAFLISNMNKKNANYAETEGTIVDIFETTAAIKLSSGEHKAISPVIKFSVADKEYEFIGKYYSTSMKIGSKVKVLYDEKNPENASIKSGLVFAPMITGILAIVFIIPIIIYFVLKSKGIITF